MVHNWENTVIEVTSPFQGQKVKEFLLKIYPNYSLEIMAWQMTGGFKDDLDCNLYGKRNGSLGFYNSNTRSIHGVFSDTIVLTLKKAQEIWDKEQVKELTFPREMIVSDNPNFALPRTACVHAILPNRKSSYKIITDDSSYRYAKEIVKEKIVIKPIEISLEKVKEELATLYNCTVKQIHIII